MKIFFALLLSISLLACGKGNDEPEFTPCPNDLALTISGAYVTGIATFKPAGSQLATTYDDAVVTVKRVDCNRVQVITTPGTFEADCTQPVMGTISGTTGSNAYNYTDATKTIGVVYTSANGDVYSFSVSK